MSTVQCPCGQSFERKPQRGRPAVWCEACRLLPMSQRVARPVVDEEGEPVTPTVSQYGSNDVLDGVQRSRIETAVAEVYAEFKTDIWPNRAKRFADTTHQTTYGRKTPDYDRAANEWLHLALVRVYHAVDPIKWPMRKGEIG